jgi:hypothetical protein
VFDLRILITPLVSSNPSFITHLHCSSFSIGHVSYKKKINIPQVLSVLELTNQILSLVSLDKMKYRQNYCCNYVPHLSKFVIRGSSDNILKKCDLHIIDYTSVVKNLIQQKYPKINDKNIIYWWMGFNILEQTKTLGSLAHITYIKVHLLMQTALKYVDLSTLYTTTPDLKLRQINRISLTIFIKK